MGKKYNSATWFGFSIYHNEKDGSDISAEQIRAKLKIALSCSDDQLRDMVLSNLSDTVKNLLIFDIFYRFVKSFCDVLY